MPDNPIFDISLETPRGERTVSVSGREHILDAAERSGLTLPFICRQGRCLTCAGLVVGGGKFDSSDADMYFPQDRQAGFILLCTAKAQTNLRIRTHQEGEMRRHRVKLGLPAPYS